MSKYPFPIKPYPGSKPPPLVSDLSECVTAIGMIEVPVKYAIDKGGACWVHAIKINNHWIDPIEFGLRESAIAVIESDCLDTEREIGGEE